MARVGRLALVALGIVAFAAADFVRIEGLEQPAVQWVLDLLS
jgi:hypothetical protein